MIYFILTLSILINIGLLWYTRTILKKFVFLSENIDELFHNLSQYSHHIEALYEMETYYGDETLERLIKHSKHIVEGVKDFKDVYSLEEETEEEIEEDVEEKKED
jgi:hypothetical protein